MPRPKNTKPRIACKICRNCGKTKPVDNFDLVNTYRLSVCKDCFTINKNNSYLLRLISQAQKDDDYKPYVAELITKGKGSGNGTRY